MQDPSCSVGKIEKWLSSPATMAPDMSLTIKRRVSIQESGVCNSRGINGDLKNDISLDFRSPFRTPPSMSYGPNEVIELCPQKCHPTRSLLGEVLPPVD